MKKNNMNFVRLRSPVFVAALMLLAMLLTLPVLGAKESAPSINQISSITLEKNNTQLVFEIQLTEEYLAEHKGAELVLFEIMPWQSASQINSLTPVAELKASAKSTVKLDYIVGNMSRLFSKFLVAEKASDNDYRIVTSARYIDNITQLAANTEPYPESLSKKGLQIQMLNDAEQLGVRHTTIDVELNKLIIGINNDDAASFLYNGESYYINKNELALLDHKVKTFSEAGINIYLNIILTEPDANASNVVWSFYCENYTPRAATYALNTANETAMKNFAAVMDYIAERYTRENHAFGFAPNFIIGFEVNDGRARDNTAAADISSSVYAYCTELRVAYSAMASHYSNGRVYISLSNNYTASSNIPGGEVNPMTDFAAKEYLDLFATAIKNSGDIPWGLSINPYPSDAALVEFWNDEYAENKPDTPFVTMKNIDVLTDYMNTESLLYNGEARSVIIGEFGASGNPENESETALQSAAFALAYYKAAMNKDIDAFIWHRQVDNGASGAYFGLWTSLDGDVRYPESKKPIYNVFEKIDTENGESVTAFVKTLVGNGIFSLIIPDNTDYKQFDARSVTDAARVDASEHAKGFEQESLLDLTKGMICGFYPTDNSQYVELKKLEGSDAASMLYARLSAVPVTNSGIGTAAFDKEALKGAHYVTLRVRVDAPTELAGINLLLRLTENGGADQKSSVFNGEALIKPNVMNEISFKIKDFVQLTDGELDSLKLLVKTPSADAPVGEYGIWLESVVLHTKNGLPAIVVILLVLLALIVLAVGGYMILYIRAERIRRKRRRARQLEMQRRMAANQQNPFNTNTNFRV